MKRIYLLMILDKLAMKIAWFLPRGVVKWCFYRVVAHATQGKWSTQLVTELTWGQAADRWEDQ